MHHNYVAFLRELLNALLTIGARHNFTDEQIYSGLVTALRILDEELFESNEQRREECLREAARLLKFIRERRGSDSGAERPMVSLSERTTLN